MIDVGKESQKMLQVLRKIVDERKGIIVCKFLIFTTDASDNVNIRIFSNFGSESISEVEQKKSKQSTLYDYVDPKATDDYIDLKVQRKTQ